MALENLIAVNTADLDAAAALFRRASVSLAELPALVVAGAHDTHAARLDAALDGFARQVGVVTDVLRTRIATMELLVDLAAHGFTAVELALARAMSS